MVNYEVLEYKLRFYGRSQSAQEKDRRAELLLGGRGDESTGPLVGRIFFYTSETLEAKQDRLDADGRPEGNMSISEIGAVVDMLRYEKPIYIVWDVRMNRVLLQTGQEPVGEEESRPQHQG
ncbi:MAG TPA: hypothetical protein VF762_04385 [Blastocatellia bacterium]|jgi:hypothetical protein